MGINPRTGKRWRHGRTTDRRRAAAQLGRDRPHRNALPLQVSDADTLVLGQVPRRDLLTSNSGRRLRYPALINTGKRIGSCDVTATLRAFSTGRSRRIGWPRIGEPGPFAASWCAMRCCASSCRTGWRSVALRRCGEQDRTQPDARSQEGSESDRGPALAISTWGAVCMLGGTYDAWRLPRTSNTLGGELGEPVEMKVGCGGPR